MSGTEPAFPIQGYGQSADSALAGPYVTAKGMSLRAYFAGLVLAGISADAETTWSKPEHETKAKYAVNAADALIAELAKGKA